MTSLQKFIAAAFANSMAADAKYITTLLEQRNPGPNSAGSFWDKPQTVESIIESAAHAEEMNVGALQFQDCKYFRLPLSGTIGVVGIDTLPAGTKLMLLDPKGTIGTPNGGVEAYYTVQAEELGKLSRVSWSLLIIGTDNGESVVFTIHPGPTFARSKNQDNPELVNKMVTKEEAQALGITIVKLQKVG
jgi:hypothetical protein